MIPPGLEKRLCFYFITDDQLPGFPALKQVEAAVKSGATAIQYRNKSFSVGDFKEAEAIAGLCRRHAVLFIVNDDILLAKALGADGVHLGDADADTTLARRILGPYAIIGRSVSTPAELMATDLSDADYIGCGPVYPTGTKADTKPVIGLSGLKAVAERSPLPVVAIGGINETRARACLEQGAAGAAVISAVTRAADPAQKALAFGRACGCGVRKILRPWMDEFALIDRMLALFDAGRGQGSILKIPPGDDAALLAPIRHPVITTDTQREGVHFRFDWISEEELGEKSVEITFSDLAASYATPGAVFVNLSIPSYMPDERVQSVCRGIKSALKRYQAEIGGGNISSGARFSIDLFAVGEGLPDLFPLRSKARAGDGLYVTGSLGLARAGLDCLVKRDAGFPGLVERFRAPAARFDAARVLAEHRVECVMDISDGLAGDAAHIAGASEVSIRFTPESFFIDPGLADYCRKHKKQPQEVILSGGEDYELLFACRPEKFENMEKQLPGAFQVGVCIPYAGEPVVDLPGGIDSYQHARGLPVSG